jgi:hypothetical protein
VEREQIDFAISELETRLDRLRALYEHYFMGIERIEPSVPRKDVERRVADLRKARFQSTAQRFKFQTIVQRYNTMQQHWSRICREIELGTFRRHRLKAERATATRSSTPAVRPQVQTPEGDVDVRAPLDSFVDGDFPAVELGTGTSPILEEAAVAAAQADPTGTSAAGVLRRLGNSGATLTKGLLTSLPPDLAARAGGKLPLPGLKRSADVAPLAAPAPVAKAAPSALGAPAPRPAPLASPPLASPPLAPPPAKASPPVAAAPKVVPPAPAPPAAAPPAAAPKTSANEGLSEARVRALHQAYVDARKQTNATSVSFEKLERSLRETESKLRSSHQGRKVDFDVVIKDGKAILKPKLT